MKMSEYIVVRSDIGLIAGKIIDSTEDTYTLEFGGKTQVVEKEYVYEENGVLFIEGYDIV